MPRRWHPKHQWSDKRASVVFNAISLDLEIKIKPVKYIDSPNINDYTGFMNKNISLVILSSFITVLTLPVAAEQNVITGKIECSISKSIDTEQCSNFSEGPMYCGKIADEKRFVIDITAPQVCLDNPVFCEGGSINTSITKKYDFDDLLFNVVFDDDSLLKMSISDKNIEIIASSSRQLKRMDKKYYNNSIQYRNKMSHYWFNCNTSH